MGKTLKTAGIGAFMLLIAFQTTFAQTRLIKGKVTSAEDSQPMPGVNILITGTSKGTVTDVDGNYSLEVPESQDQLTFTFVGYKTVTLSITGKSTLDVVLESDAIALDEVVVIGYGQVRKSDLTGSVSSIRGSDLTSVPALNPIQSLQGKVAGLQVSTTSGAPGSSSYVRIRGVGTFNDASPIYVVDGVILQDIDFLNAADITSMQVLKDASATAIYGSRGANGVIIITTRQGASGNKFPTINISAEYSMQDLPKKIDVLSGREYAIVRNKINPGTYNNIDAVPNTDWQSLIFGTAPIQNYQVSVSGGSDKAQYYSSIGYFKQGGIIEKSGYERVSMKFNSTIHISDAIKVGTNLSFTPYKQQNTSGNAVFAAYRAWPTISPFKPDGTYSEVPGVGNVLADIAYTNSSKSGLRSVNSIYTEVRLFKDFYAKSSFGVDLEYYKEASYTPVYYVSPQQLNATDDLTKKFFGRVDWLWENTLNYRKQFGKNRIDAIAGYTMQQSSSETVRLGAQNLLRPGDDFHYVNIFPNTLSPNYAYNEVDPAFNYAMMSYLFRANYTYDDKYLFTATFRRDGSSKFTPSNRYANFPSLAVGWNVINEEFLKSSDKISNLKVRASWGIIGNEKIPYTRQYSLVLNGVNAVFGNDVIIPGATYDVSGNPKLKWESTQQVDVGVELGLFNDKLTAEIDYYNRTTKDILIDLPVPGYLGNGDGAVITFNAGEVVNKGIELNLGWSDDLSADWKYRIGVVGTTIHNETKAVSGTGGTDDRLLGLVNGKAVTRTIPGIPIGSFYGYKVGGVFQNATELSAYPHLSDTGVGDLKFIDTNDDGELNEKDRVNLGSPIPKLLYGLNIYVAYKNIDLTMDIQGVYGNKIYNAKETIRPDPYNFEQRYYNFWDGDGSSNSEPRPSNGGVNFEPSSRFIYDGSFIRLRNVSVGYTLPSKITSLIGIKSVRAYARVTNLFTKSKFTGYTPEIVSSNPILNGIDQATYPVPRIFSVGLNLTL